jgi:hypothetical protein
MPESSENHNPQKNKQTKMHPDDVFHCRVGALLILLCILMLLLLSLHESAWKPLDEYDYWMFENMESSGFKR